MTSILFAGAIVLGIVSWFFPPWWLGSMILFVLALMQSTTSRQEMMDHKLEEIKKMIEQLKTK